MLIWELKLPMKIYHQLLQPKYLWWYVLIATGKCQWVIFFINSLTGEENANLVTLCVSKLSEVDVKIISLTCDGPSCHLTIFKVLGGNMDLEQPQPWFKHPEFPLEINIILDICHMLQLVRNAWEF
jgi:hypothetical protein